MPGQNRLLTALALIAVAPAAWSDHLSEIIVTGRAAHVTLDAASSALPAVDSAALLKQLPGADVNSNGPLSGIQQYRGLYGNRVGVSVDGMTIASGGPNLMDPPLSYAPATLLESLTVYRDIAPVSAGQETLGGAIEATTIKTHFTDSDAFSSQGDLLAGAASVNRGRFARALVGAANRHNAIHVIGLTEQGDDARFDGGRIRPSEYERRRLDSGYQWQCDHQYLSLAVTRNETGDAGTPALPMDIKTIDSDLYRASYRYRLDGWSFAVEVHDTHVDHSMTNYHLRRPPADAGRYRRNDANSDGRGWKLTLERRAGAVSWLVGTDGELETHDAVITNPNQPGFRVVNFNGADKRILGFFSQLDYRFGDTWQLHAGARINRVSMQSGSVYSSMAMMMPAVATLQARFNAADRHRSDYNVDWTASVDYTPNEQWTVTLGIARKSRSPSYQALYLWLPLQSAGGLADGNNYVGSPDLDSEISHEADFGFDWQTERFTLSPRVFYRKIDNYIQGVPSTDPVVNMVSNSMSGVPALQFANVRARMYGADLRWSAVIAGPVSFSGVASYVRGKRDDIHDNLYRVAAPHMSVALNYRVSRWDTTLEGVVYGPQHNVSATNGELRSKSYTLLNWRFEVRPMARLTLNGGVENLLDKRYYDHLAGINRAYNPDIAVGEPLPGWGRNIYGRLRWRW